MKHDALLGNHAREPRIETCTIGKRTHKHRSDHAISIATGGLPAKTLKAHKPPKPKTYRRAILLRKNEDGAVIDKREYKRYLNSNNIRQIRKATAQSKPRSKKSDNVHAMEIHVRKLIRNPRPIVEKPWSSADITAGRKLAHAIATASESADLY